LRVAERRIHALERDGPEGLRALNRQLQEQMEGARKTDQKHQEEAAAAAGDLRARYDELLSQCAAEQAKGQELTAQLESRQDELARRDQLDKTRANLVRGAMKLEGRLWMRKVLRGAPKFRSLSERHAAIISVLNLKGGVGKTTVTAHLGAAFAAKGYRVLLLDLDLQGSLSSLFIPESTLAKRSEEDKLLLQHFLLGAADKRKSNLLEYRVPIFDGKSAVVPSADSMAYAELNLTMQWLFRQCKRDTRFLLRRALHQRRVTRHFDLVLLDCPPLFNTCCVNALAASDYVVIPVVPSTKAAERVPLLLERLQVLHGVINPELRVAGVLFNRTHSAQLASWERDLWQQMLGRCKDRWKQPVPAFETFIRQSPEVRGSEVEFTPPEPGSELYGVFARLAAELERGIPGDCC
jgi:chromosome partitioning protein